MRFQWYRRRSHPMLGGKICIVLFLLLVCASFSHAKVGGQGALAPTLPPDVPGVDRPFPQDGQKFTFAIVGDKTGGGQRNWPIFDRAIDEINRLRPDFALIVGDLIQGYTTDINTMDAQWKEFMEHASRIQVPFFFLPGNHDISNKVMYQYWEEHVGRTYYSFDYKDCHFLLLNTEEGWRSGEIQFGAVQMEFVRRDLQSHRDSKHIFIFMHRPVWYHTGERLAQWETIESYLQGLPYTVFAGHFHNLAYEIRKDHRYFVLSATGAGLTPNDVLPLGAFHHYTMVTVDGNDVHIALIQPGNIHPEDIAPREFKEKARQILSYERHFPLTAGRTKGQLVIHLNDTLDKPLKVKLQFTIPEGTTWSIAPNAATHTIRPGETAELVFNAAYTPEDIQHLPAYSYEVFYGDLRMWQGNATLVPVDSGALVSVKEWMVVGPFALGSDQRPKSEKDLEADVPNFVRALEPEQDWNPSRTYAVGDKPLAWREADANDKGSLDLNAIYGGDYRIAYGQCAIYSPDDRLVFASIQGDDVTKVFVNGKEVHAGFPVRGAGRTPDYFALPLKQGWNVVLVKSADYTGGWAYTLRVADPKGELQFARRVP